MKQLYEVGETVLIKNSNVECVVEEVSFEETEITGQPGLHTGFYYKVGVVGPNGNDKWTQASLRKKHEPSQQSFKDLMTTLKSPQKVEWD